jgi:hypothetical protein
MNFKWTKNCIYEKSASRIKARISETHKKLEDIYPPNEKIISHITNLKISQKNPYLIQDSVVLSSRKISDNKYEEIGIAPSLGFKTRQEVLWGKEEEIRRNIPEIFHNLIYDLILCNSELDIDIYNIVCDHVSYAKYSTYYRILNNRPKGIPAYYYRVLEDDIYNNIDSARESAIDYLFSKSNCRSSFEKMFIEFCSATDSYTKLDKKIEKNLVIPRVIPLLRQFVPDINSLGLRVKDIIESDLEKLKALAFIPPDMNLHFEKLITISNNYVNELEYLQNAYIAKINGGEF